MIHYFRVTQMLNLGTTQIVLMIVVVIFAILVSVPHYSCPSPTPEERRRAFAQRALVDAANRQEKFFYESNTYTTSFGATGINMPTATEGNLYTLSVVAPTAACPIATCYQLQAIPQGAQAGDDCGTLALTSSGVKSPTNCW